jgi:hypothetical protein
VVSGSPCPYDTLRPTAAAVDAYVEHIRRGLPGTVWTTGCSSWYQGPDGLPELWPYLPQDYLRLLNAPDDHSYILECGSEPEAAPSHAAG